ncbi:hypothetical protein [Sphingosinicella sp. BN140058]|uniref:hypothetical protein n=1 Tax=Sphingosinicella sp. BN140058 TaxID=1892855 RepID=UPI0010114DA8|nr:hypothetical protein [Sphingosinicella sp. BN140058]QAY78989.1 hypothetical protein ETR14_22470 [Sphingosinicella sp. BN140058]
MGRERTTAALGRLERALARIEASAVASRTPAPGAEDVDTLRRNHLALRAKVEGAIGEIDRLLDTQGRV